MCVRAQTLETPLHYVSRTGNVDTLDEIAQYMNHRILTVINRQAKVLRRATCIPALEINVLFTAHTTA